MKKKWKDREKKERKRLSNNAGQQKWLGCDWWLMKCSSRLGGRERGVRTKNK